MPKRKTAKPKVVRVKAFGAFDGTKNKMPCDSHRKKSYFSEWQRSYLFIRPIVIEYTETKGAK